MEKTLEPLKDQLEDTEQQIIDMVRVCQFSAFGMVQTSELWISALHY